MKKLLMALVAIGILAGLNVVAGDEDGEGTEQELKGKIIKQQKKNKAGKVRTRYVLQAEGKSRIPLPRPKKSKEGDDEAVIELDEYVDKDVTIKVLTIERENKKGKKFTRILQILEITPTESDGEADAE